jgi:hypothetical protein
MTTRQRGVGNGKHIGGIASDVNLPVWKGKG